MSCKFVEEFLKASGVEYQVLRHNRVFTAKHTANVLRVPTKAFAKLVILAVDQLPVFVLLPASHHVDFKKVQKELPGAQTVRLPKEEIFVEYFRRLGIECEAGAMYPFGNLYGVPILVDERLLESGEIYFKAGSHGRSIKMSTEDFLKLVLVNIADRHQPMLLKGNFAIKIPSRWKRRLWRFIKKLLPL